MLLLTFLLLGDIYLKIISLNPASMISSTMYWIIGFVTMGSISLGIALVAGNILVPSPAIGTITFFKLLVFKILPLNKAYNKAIDN